MKRKSIIHLAALTLGSSLAQGALIHHYGFENVLTDGAGSIDLAANGASTTSYGSGIVGTSALSVTRAQADYVESTGPVIPGSLSTTDLTNDVTYTVSWWAKTADPAPTGDNWMIGQGNNGTAPQGKNFHSGFISSANAGAPDGFNHAYWSSDLATQSSVPIGSETVGSIKYNTTAWNFYALTYDADTDTRKSFINGVEIATQVLATAPYRYGGSDNFYVGTRRDGQNSYTGLIDDVKIYDNAVDGAALAAEYALIIPEPSTGLLSGFVLLLLARRRR